MRARDVGQLRRTGTDLGEILITTWLLHRTGLQLSVSAQLRAPGASEVDRQLTVRVPGTATW